MPVTRCLGKGYIWGYFKMDGMDTVDWIGFIGVFQIVLAYMLNVFGKLDKEDLAFIILNFMGASLACTASVLMDYMPFIILEGVWAMVSLITLVKYNKNA